MSNALSDLVTRMGRESVFDVTIERQGNALVLRRPQHRGDFLSQQDMTEITELISTDKRIHWDSKYLSPHQAHSGILSLENLSGWQSAMRIVTAATKDGAFWSLRYVNTQLTHRRLDDLGLTQSSLALIKRLSERTSGLILLAGYTGSGKSLLSSALASHLAATGRSVEIRAEVVFEYGDPALHYGTHDGSTASPPIASDKDVVVVDDVRSQEQLEQAQSVAREHLVISSVHSGRGLAATLSRIQSLGVPDVLSELVGVIGISLEHRLCRTCAVIAPAANQEGLLEHWPDGVAKPTRVGLVDAAAQQCQSCHGRGFQGRTPIVEVSELWDDGGPWGYNTRPARIDLAERIASLDVAGDVTERAEWGGDDPARTWPSRGPFAQD